LPTERLNASLRELLAALLERGFGITLDALERLARKLDAVAARSGVKVNALLGAVRAALEGKSMVWGSIKGGFSALSPAAKAAVILGLVLAVLLLPVTVVLLLLALIIVAVIAAVKTRSATR
jgi:hypothetical protein